MDEKIFYDLYPTLTHDCLFNFILGMRGVGKTFALKVWAIKNYKKSKKQWIYIRRFESEFTEKMKQKFFKDIYEKFPDDELTIKGDNILLNDEVMGYLVPLSTSIKLKSTPFPDVDKIIFDEFIITDSVFHYLRNEVILFLELYSTIARLRDVKVFFLSNAISITNPYFLYFKLTATGDKRYTHFGDILVEYVEAKEFVDVAKNTRFGKLIGGTKYGEYALENKYLQDTDTFIEKKGKNARTYCTLEYKEQKLGIWVDYKIGKFWVSDDIDMYNKLVYTLTIKDHKPNTILIKSKTSMLKSFVEAYKNGCVFFESINIKNITYEIIRLFLL